MHRAGRRCPKCRTHTWHVADLCRKPPPIPVFGTSIKVWPSAFPKNLAVVRPLKAVLPLPLSQLDSELHTPRLLISRRYNSRIELLNQYCWTIVFVRFHIPRLDTGEDQFSRTDHHPKF